MIDYEKVKLSKEDIAKIPQYSRLSEDELNSIIEMIWQYSQIVYKAYNKSNKLEKYE